MKKFIAALAFSSLVLFCASFDQCESPGDLEQYREYIEILPSGPSSDPAGQDDRSFERPLQDNLENDTGIEFDRFMHEHSFDTNPDLEIPLTPPTEGEQSIIV